MSERPNILFLTHRVPYPPNRGDRIRSWNILRYLSERANMHLACLTDEPVSEETIQVLNQTCERVAIEPLSNLGRWINGIWSLVAGKSATGGLFKSNRLQQTVRKWAKETPFDSVLVFCSSMYQFATCPELQGIPVVVDLVDVDSEKWLNYAETASFFKRQLYRLEAKRVRKLEMAIADRAKAVTLVSDEEVKVFRQFCDSDNVYAISNGVDLDYFHPAPETTKSEDEHSPTEPKPFKLVFVGVLDYRANIEGLKWFCREVWPKVRESIQGVELDLVGRRPGDAVRDLAKLPGINLIGEVDDVRPYVWNADVVIAPLTIARGIQNKVLEAMAMGKPVVATPEAVEGIFRSGAEQIISSSDPAEWKRQLVDLHLDLNSRLALSWSGREAIESVAAWPSQLSNLSRLVLPRPRANVRKEREHVEVSSS